MGGRIEKRAEERQGRDAVSYHMMQADEQRDVAIGQSSEEPHLPQRTGSLERRSVQLRAQTQQRCLIPGGRKHARVHVLADVEARIVDPQWRPQAESRLEQRLTQTRSKVQAALDRNSNGPEREPP